MRSRSAHRHPGFDFMTEITSMLSLAADSCGGVYDGWETQLIR